MRGMPTRQRDTVSGYRQSFRSPVQPKSAAVDATFDAPQPRIGSHLSRRSCPAGQQRTWSAAHFPPRSCGLQEDQWRGPLWPLGHRTPPMPARPRRFSRHRLRTPDAGPSRHRSPDFRRSRGTAGTASDHALAFAQRPPERFHEFVFLQVQGAPVQVLLVSLRLESEANAASSLQGRLVPDGRGIVQPGAGVRATRFRSGNSLACPVRRARRAAPRNAHCSLLLRLSRMARPKMSPPKSSERPSLRSSSPDYRRRQICRGADMPS